MGNATTMVKAQLRSSIILLVKLVLFSSAAAPRKSATNFANAASVSDLVTFSRKVPLGAWLAEAVLWSIPAHY